MKYSFLLILVLFLSNCSKPKTVLICGDHVCINSAEAEQYSGHCWWRHDAEQAGRQAGLLRHG